MAVSEGRDAEIVKQIDNAFEGKGFPPYFKPQVLLERALILHAPDVRAERAQLIEVHGDVEGYNCWAETYSLPMRRGGGGRITYVFHDIAFPEGPDQRIEEVADRPPNVFTFRNRWNIEKPSTYSKRMDQEYRAWKHKIMEAEKQLYKAQPKKRSDLKQARSAEWYVLNKLKGKSAVELSTLEFAGWPKRLKDETVSKGIRRFEKQLEFNWYD